MTLKLRHAALVTGLMAAWSGAAWAEEEVDDQDSLEVRIEEAKETAKKATETVEALEAEQAEAVAGTSTVKALGKTVDELKTTIESLRADIKKMPVAEPVATELVGFKTDNCKDKKLDSATSLAGYKKALGSLKNAAIQKADPDFKFTIQAKTKSYRDDLASITDCALDLFTDASFIASKKPATPSSSAEAVDKASFEQIKSVYAEIAHQDVYSRPQATLLLGPSFVLRGDGQFRGGVETTLLFDGGAGSFFGYGRTFTDISFQSKGQLGTQPIAEDADANAVLDTQFSSDKGYFRFNTGVSTQINDRVSFALSGGLNAVPREEQEFPESLRERYTATIVTRTFLSQGIYTRFAIGGAYDKSWRYFNEVPVTTPPTMVTPADQRESYGRAIVNMELFLPQANGLAGGISAAARLSLDTPINGDGPSEVRLSILAYLDFRDFFKALNPLYKGPGG